MPTLQEDPCTPLGNRDAGPSGLRHPRIEDSSMPTYYPNPVVPQGPQDAGPSSELRSGVDDTPWQPSCQYSTPASKRTPRCRAEIRVHALMTNTRTDYECRYGKLPTNNAPSRASREVITPTPTTAATIPSDDEDSELSRQGTYTQLPQVGAQASNQPMSSSLESYQLILETSTPENPLFSPDPALYNVRKLTEALKALRGRGQELFEALHLTFNDVDREQTFPTQ